jgi:hypothetical protein
MQRAQQTLDDPALDVDVDLGNEDQPDGRNTNNYRAFLGHSRHERSPLSSVLCLKGAILSLASTARKFDSKNYVVQMG